MTYNLFFFLSLATLVVTVIISFIRKFGYKSHRLFTPYRILFGGTYVSAFLLFLPICLKQFSRLTPFSQHFGAILISAHHAIRLFAIDNDFAVILEGLAAKAVDPETYWLSIAYAVLGAVLYILSPPLPLRHFPPLSSRCALPLHSSLVLFLLPLLLPFPLLLSPLSP